LDLESISVFFKRLLYTDDNMTALRSGSQGFEHHFKSLWKTKQFQTKR